jgi:branched-chain amino acid transport system ATP-binding protein
MLLELRQVTKSYGSNPVIRGLDLTVNKGEFVGVIGPNGAGKTTAFGVIAGHLPCDGGSVWLNGVDVTAKDANSRCGAGIGRTFQVPQPFVGLSVFENVLVASSFGAGLSGRKAETAAKDALATCGLSALANQAAGGLGLLQRKRLEVARALATDAEVHELLDLVLTIHAQGVTVLWIEHLVHALVSVVRRLVVLTEGTVLADGEPQTVIASPAVRESYLGSELDLEEEDQHVAH